MSSLRTLLGDTIGGGSLPQKIFYVYNNNRGMSNGGCCCYWTVPADIKNATFEDWGGGGAGTGACCCQWCLGYTGYKSYVTGSSIPSTCANGGCGGTTMCHAHHAYNCCHGWHCIEGGTNGNFKLGRGRDHAMNTHYCHNQMWDQIGGGVKSSMSRKSTDFCSATMVCSGCGWGCSDDYPSGGSYNATVCGNPCCWGQWSSGGMVKITYS